MLAPQWCINTSEVWDFSIKVTFHKHTYFL